MSNAPTAGAPHDLSCAPDAPRLRHRLRLRPLPDERFAPAAGRRPVRMPTLHERLTGLAERFSRGEPGSR